MNIFNPDPLFLIEEIERRPAAIKKAKDALEYTSEDKVHLCEFYKKMLIEIAKHHEPDLLFNLYAKQIGVKTVKEAQEHFIKQIGK